MIAWSNSRLFLMLKMHNGQKFAKTVGQKCRSSVSLTVDTAKCHHDHPSLWKRASQNWAIFLEKSVDYDTRAVHKSFSLRYLLIKVVCPNSCWYETENIYGVIITASLSFLLYLINWLKDLSVDGVIFHARAPKVTDATKERALLDKFIYSLHSDRQRHLL